MERGFGKRLLQADAAIVMLLDESGFIGMHFAARKNKQRLTTYTEFIDSAVKKHEIGSELWTTLNTISTSQHTTNQEQMLQLLYSQGLAMTSISLYQTTLHLHLLKQKQAAVSITLLVLGLAVAKPSGKNTLCDSQENGLVGRLGKQFCREKSVGEQDSGFLRGLAVWEIFLENRRCEIKGRETGKEERGDKLWVLSFETKERVAKMALRLVIRSMTITVDKDLKTWTRHEPILDTQIHSLEQPQEFLNLLILIRELILITQTSEIAFAHFIAILMDISQRRPEHIEKTVIDMVRHKLASIRFKKNVRVGGGGEKKNKKKGNDSIDTSLDQAVMDANFPPLHAQVVSSTIDASSNVTDGTRNVTTGLEVAMNSPNPDDSANKAGGEQVSNEHVNEFPSSYATKLSPTSSTKANLRKLEANVPNDVDHDVWLPLASVYEVNYRMKNSLYGDNLVMDVPNLEGTRYTNETIRIEYEWKPFRCSTCLIYDHSLVDCPKVAPKRVVNIIDKGKGQTSRDKYECFIEVKKKKSSGNNGDNKNFKPIWTKPKTHYRSKVKQSTEGTRNSPKTTLFVGTNKASTSGYNKGS
ncbi:hypothetical protein Tco_0811078 [Tanacetum coccineum]